jgi:hypothetical protein
MANKLFETKLKCGATIWLEEVGYGLEGWRFVIEDEHWFAAGYQRGRKEPIELNKVSINFYNEMDLRRIIMRMLLHLNKNCTKDQTPGRDAPDGGWIYLPNHHIPLDSCWRE